MKRDIEALKKLADYPNGAGVLTLAEAWKMTPRAVVPYVLALKRTGSYVDIVDGVARISKQGLEAIK